MATKRAVKEHDIAAIKELLAGTNALILAPSDSGWQDSLHSWSRAAEKPSGVSIIPTCSEEVSITVKYASEHDLDVAVKGGGHSTSGASSTNGGLLINLKAMRNVSVDPEAQLLHVQGGALWMDVDKAAWKHGLATVGGTVADTGVGGLTLGGGYGHLTSSRGLVIDNVVAATVVVANGEIKRVSKTENEDLFWALLGAGQNFGVTTEFVLQAFPQSEVYAGSLVFLPTPETIRKVVDVANDLFTVRHTPEGPRCKVNGQSLGILGLARPPEAGGQTVLLVVLSCVTGEETGKALFQPFFDIGPIVNTMALHPWPVVNALVPTLSGMRSSMKGAATVLPIRAEFVMEVMSKYDEFLNAQEDAAASLIAWEIYDPIKVVQSDIGCYANRGYHLNALVMPQWAKAENDQICRQWARDMSLMFKHDLESHGATAGKGVDGGVGIRGNKGAVMLYGNYDQYDEISKDIFGQHYPRLQALKAKYDPKNMFNKLFPIQPAM